MRLEATCIRDHKYVVSSWVQNLLLGKVSLMWLSLLHESIINSIYFSKLCQDTEDWKPSESPPPFFFQHLSYLSTQVFARILQRMLVKYITVSELYIMLKTQLPQKELQVYY